jgi:5'/3'-nucleotidase
VVMAARKVLPDAPDLVLSGVNRGQNIADDVTYSGTIAAAMEGTVLGFKSIALSQVIGMHNREGLTYDVAERHGAKVLKQLLDVELGPGVLLNINFPDCRPDEVAGVEVTRQGKRDQNLLTIDERRDTRGRPYYWVGFQRERGNPPIGTDLRAAFEKRISVTPLHMNLTQLEAIEPLRVALEKT